MAQVLTRNGYDLWEVTSALQKEIRRGKEEEAYYWALELMPKFEKHLLTRLLVIAHEDIGLANPMLPVILKSYHDTFVQLRQNGNGGAKLVLANMILVLCRSKKSRLSDEFNAAVEQDKEQGRVKRTIPDYAMDKHTLKGKRLGRGPEHWLDEGCLLVNEIDPENGYAKNPYKVRARAMFTRQYGEPVRIPWPETGKKDTAKQVSLFDTEPPSED